MLNSILCLSLLITCTTVAPPCFCQDDPPVPPKKNLDDPPVPSKKKLVTKVEVTAEKAEIRSGDDLLAEVPKGTVLEYVKKNEEYFLVQMDNKKGWIKQTDAKLVMIDESKLTLPPSSKEANLKSSDGSITLSIKQGRIYAKSTRDNMTWSLPAEGDKELNILAVQFTPKEMRNLLILVTDTQIMSVEPLSGKYLWTNSLRIENAAEATIQFADNALLVKCGKTTCSIDIKTGQLISRKNEDE